MVSDFEPLQLHRLREQQLQLAAERRRVVLARRDETAERNRTSTAAEAGADASRTMTGTPARWRVGVRALLFHLRRA